MNCKMEQTMTGEECTQCVKTAETYCEPPSDVDIEMAISKLKNRKATGSDQIPAELIKEGGKELKKVNCQCQLPKYGRNRSYHMRGNMA